MGAVFEAKHHTEGVLEGKYFNVYRTKRHTVYINATEIIIMLNNVVTSGDLKGVMHFQRKMVNGMTEMVLVKVNGS
ncbi:hypothetical protein H4R19_004176 [Coemansia spiralis]|nr:hypothetical protein H4R19_004176 [Coemansia spiralis]